MKHSIELDVPEGYEIINQSGTVEINSGSPVIILHTKKKQVKDFSFYVDEYLGTSGVSTIDQISNWLNRDQRERIATNLKLNKFSLVPWEIKIGLCCFICNEVGIPWSEYIHQFNETVYCDEIKQVNDIVPEMFRDDIINKTK